MLKLPWKMKGILLSAPRPNELDLFEEFVEKKLAPGGCNLIVLRVCYGYRFASHPECASPDQPLGVSHVKRIVEVCKKNKIKLIPKMNLLGHQAPNSSSDFKIDKTLGLLRGHPEFDETPDLEKVEYCRSLCPNHHGIKPVVHDLMDEMIDVFMADSLHIGCDEVFVLGECERCRDIPKDRLFADWVNDLAGHIKASRGARTLMWGDRLLNAQTTGYGEWEASANHTENAVNLLNKDNFLICDWHYENMEKGYPSVDIFADSGYKMMVCPLHKQNSEKFIKYAMAHDRGHIEGFLQTTWEESGQIAGFMLRNPDDYPGRRFNTERLKKMAETIDWIF
jgi:hypothetical protein